MGAGIAIVAARGGYETLCFDMSDEALKRQRGSAEKFFGKSVEMGRMSQDDADATLARMTDTTDLNDLAECDLIIEAIFEDLEVKKELFGKLNGICKD